MTTQVNHWKDGNGTLIAKVGSTSVRVLFDGFTSDFFVAMNDLTINGKKVTKKQWQELMNNLPDVSKADMQNFIETSDLKKNFKLNGKWNFDFLANHFSLEIKKAKEAGKLMVCALDFFYNSDGERNEYWLCLTDNGNLQVSVYA